MKLSCLIGPRSPSGPSRCSSQCILGTFFVGALSDDADAVLVRGQCRGEKIEKGSEDHHADTADVSGPVPLGRDEIHFVEKSVGEGGGGADQQIEQFPHERGPDDADQRHHRVQQRQDSISFLACFGNNGREIESLTMSSFHSSPNWGLCVCWGEFGKWNGQSKM